MYMFDHPRRQPMRWFKREFAASPAQAPVNIISKCGTSSRMDQRTALSRLHHNVRSAMNDAGGRSSNCNLLRKPDSLEI